MVDCRVLIVSQRQRPDGFGRQPGYVAFNEAEDILADCTGADLAMVDRNPTHPAIRARRLAGRGLRRVAGNDQRLPGAAALPFRVPAIEQPVHDHYDLAVFVGFTMWDLPLLQHALRGRGLADRIAVWFPEAWASEFADGRLDYEPFGFADAIFVGMEAACHQLAAIAPGPVHHLPPAVDVLRFAPLPPEGPRPIDVLGIGRRDRGLHAALLDWSQRAGKLYVYDTISGSQVGDARAHRVNLGDTYRRTNVALTNYAKYDMPQVTRGEREVPGRLWEGLASGAILVGRAPDDTLQRKLIGESVVVDLPAEPLDAVDLIGKLHRDANETIRRHHVKLALRRHDWAHRWASIFTGTGLEVPAGLRTRIDELATIAASLDQRSSGPASAPAFS
jgi:hypothetical protein